MRSMSQLPGPKGLPLVGNLFQVDLSQMPAELERRVAEYGTLYRLKFGPKTFVMVADIDLIHEVLRHRPTKYRRLGGIERLFKEIGANGLFSAEGDTWRRHRTLTAPAFNVAHLRQFFATMTAVTERLLARWDPRAEKHDDVDVLLDLTRFTVDITTNLAFGYDMNTLQQDGAGIQQHLEHIFPSIQRRLNWPFPYWRYVKLPADRRLDRAMAGVKQTIHEIIQNCRERQTANPGLREQPTNLLEAMLAADVNLPNDELFGAVMTILVAGEDTTANSLAWILHHMVEHPEVQAKARAEALAVMGDSSVLRSYQDLERLPYIEAVMHESMRFQPVAPILFMEAAIDVELGGVKIPKGTAIVLMTRSCAMRAENFTAPLEFRPERWLSDQRTPDMNHNIRAFLPFGGGPRFCPGRALAITEIKTVVAAIMRRFVLSKPNNGRVPAERFSFVAIPSDLWVNFAPL